MVRGKTVLGHSHVLYILTMGGFGKQLGHLDLAKELPYSAKADFETALTQSPDHATATVGLCNILLDIYSEKLLPAPAMPSLDGSAAAADERTADLSWSRKPTAKDDTGALPSSPLGLGPPLSASLLPATQGGAAAAGAGESTTDESPAPYKTTRLLLVDRLAARERALTLLSGLTRLGTGWDHTDAWFALARAHEESGQAEKAKEVLWWCVELEEARGVREWRSLGSGGYIM